MCMARVLMRVTGFVGTGWTKAEGEGEGLSARQHQHNHQKTDIISCQFISRFNYLRLDWVTRGPAGETGQPARGSMVGRTRESVYYWSTSAPVCPCGQS